MDKLSAVGLKRDLLLENLTQREWTKTGIMSLGCNAAQGRETGDSSMETKKNCKRRKENKMMREKWEMKTSLHLIKHIIRRHSKRDWGKHYVDFQKETRDISHGQSTTMSSTHTLLLLQTQPKERHGWLQEPTRCTQTKKQPLTMLLFTPQNTDGASTRSPTDIRVSE